MEIINSLLYGLKTGDYWFIRATAIMNVISIPVLLAIEHSNFKTYEDRVKALNFGARLVMATLTLFICSNLFVMVPGNILKYVIIVIGIIVLIMMVKVDKLPIWEERAE